MPVGNGFILVYMLTIFVLGIRWVYWSSKLSAYIHMNLPEKAKELGLAQPHSIKFSRLVYKMNDVNDPRYLRLRTKSQRAGFLAIFSIILPLLVKLLFELIHCIWLISLYYFRTY